MVTLPLMSLEEIRVVIDKWAELITDFGAKYKWVQVRIFFTFFVLQILNNMREYSFKIKFFYGGSSFQCQILHIMYMHASFTFRKTELHGAILSSNSRVEHLPVIPF